MLQTHTGPTADFAETEEATSTAAMSKSPIRIPLKSCSHDIDYRSRMISLYVLCVVVDFSCIGVRYPISVTSRHEVYCRPWGNGVNIFGSDGKVADTGNISGILTPPTYDIDYRRCMMSLQLSMLLLIFRVSMSDIRYLSLKIIFWRMIWRMGTSSTANCAQTEATCTGPTGKSPTREY